MPLGASRIVPGPNRRKLVVRPLPALVTVRSVWAAANCCTLLFVLP